MTAGPMARGLGLLLVVSLLGCSDPPVRVPVLRFIEQTTPPVFDPGAFTDKMAVREWRPTGSGGGWQARDVQSERSDSLGWWLEPAASKVVFERHLAAGETVDAAEVNLVAVTAEGRSLASADLHWAGEGEALRPSWHLRDRHAGNTRHTYLFRTGEHPGWRGDIGRLQVTVWTAPGRSVCVRSVRLLREVITPEILDAAVARPWRVELGDQQRVALAALPERPVRRSFKVPEGADFRFAWGGFGELPAALRFLVVAVEANGARHRLFDQPAPESGWRSSAVDLSPFGGRHIELRLEVAGDSVDVRRGMPLWAHPEVLADGDVAGDVAGDSVGDSAWAALDQRPNVVLIVLDTLRADRLSLYGYDRRTSPHLDAWARRRATIFEKTVAAAGWTLPSHVSLFTGLDAHRHGVNWPSKSVGELTLLAERLHAAGYATEAVTGGGYLDRAFGLDQGFERFRSFARRPGNHHTEAPSTLDQAYQALRRMRDRPFFLFVHTYATHTPYSPWQPFFGSFSDHDPLREVVYRKIADGVRGMVLKVRDGDEILPLEGPLRDLPPDQYDAGIARLDGLLRPLLEALDDRELARRTVVVITSDHGEMLGEGDRWQHGHLGDPVLMVPLILALPDRRSAGRRVARQVRSVDLLPTLLELTGVEPAHDIDGVSLVPLLAGREESSPPAAAWSYGHDGLALRIRDRWKMLLHDDLESPRAGRISSFANGDRPIATPAELEPYLELARRRLLEQMPGLRLRFSNRDGSEDLRVDVESQASMTERVKVPDLPCDCVDYSRFGQLRVRVPPGVAFTMILADVREAQLLLTLHRADSSRQRLDVDLLDLEMRLAFTATAAGWQISSGKPPATGVGLRWHRAGLARFEDPSGDSELRQSLRALGYLQ